MPDDDLERPPSLWPWIIGGLIGLFLIGMVVTAIVGSIVQFMFKVLLYGAVGVLIVWCVTRLVRGRPR